MPATVPPGLLPRRRLLRAAAGIGYAILPAVAQTHEQAAPFQPKPGQPGKDVVWLPTPDAVVERLLRMAQLGSRDTLVDLGSGDGKFVIAAARDFRARARGIELVQKLVELARWRARVAGVEAMTRFEQEDLFAADFSDADVVAMYLLPHLNLRLRPKLLRMKPGTRIVAHQFPMGDWQPDETSVLENRPGYLWIVPANAGGTWRFKLSQRDGTSMPVALTITQTFQRITGIATLGELQTTLRAPRLEGRRIAFGFTDAVGDVRQFDAEIHDDRMQGRVDGTAFTARRIGAAPAIGGSGPATHEEEQAAGALLGDY